MPTARELLEQADALMRRNRASADDDIPVLTDAVPSAQEAQSRFAPRVDPGASPARVPEATPGIDVHDEVPLLTDAVEEIEAAALIPAVDEGEPSDWLELREGEPSVIGDAPDSIAIVPPVDLDRPEPTPDFDEFDGLDEELAAAIAAAQREEETLLPTRVAKVPEAPTMPVTEARAIVPAVVSDGAAALLHDAAIAAPASPTFTLPVPSEPTAVPVTPMSTLPVPSEPTAVPVTPVFTLPEEPESFAPPAPPVAVDDSAHWKAMAEEVRMQVLQRIDLFTDTGLRTQLGERLQPIVDRASADLVATINLHVGELLRAYVAEAIEREIESWRKNH
ncbi:MAG: hypothetical protein ABI607_01345 [Betaproteobacteria bacterium]